jgi:hypothetical protein
MEALMNMQLLIRIGATAIALSLTTCKPEVSRVTWDPIDPVASQQSIAHPDGDIGFALSEDFISDLDDNMELLVRRLTLMLDVMASIAENGGDENWADDTVDTEYTPSAGSHPPTPGETTLSGTNLYLRKVCPGDNPDAPLSEENGEVRLDVNGLKSLDDLDSLTSDMNFLMQFNECRIRGEVIDRETAGWVDDKDGLMMLVDLYPEYFFLLSSVDGHGTYRLGISITDTEVSVTIAAADGIAGCTWDATGENFAGCALNDDPAATDLRATE